MRTLLAAAAAVALVTGLAACSAPDAGAKTPSATPTAAVAAAETPAPTPTPMSVAAAGDHYLDIICPANAANAEWYNTANSGADLATIKALAPKTIEAYREAARQLDDPTAAWPSNVTEDDLHALRDSYLSWISTLTQIVNATTIEQANAAVWDDSSSGGAASQRIRLHLELPADGVQSCQER